MRHSGMQGIRNALAAGLTVNQIREQAAREGITFGGDAQAFLADRSPTSFIAQYGGNPYTMANTGQKAIDRALESGLTINQIREQAAKEGLSFGSGAQQYLSARPETSFIAQYGGNEATMRHSGMEAVNRALVAGLTPADIDKRAAAEGISFGTNAAAFLGSQRQIAESQARMQQMQQQYMDAQRQAQEAAERQARQMQIAQAMGQQDSADVRFSQSKAAKKKLTAAGTSGYFGRKGLRIGSVNVASQGGGTSGSGSFA
jgi:hypothetical protein